MFKIGQKMNKIDPKMWKIRQIAPQNIQKVRKLLQNSYSGQKTRDFPLKSYCWSPILLGSSFPASHTICPSAKHTFDQMPLLSPPKLLVCLSVCMSFCVFFQSSCQWRLGQKPEFRFFWKTSLTKLIGQRKIAPREQ